MNQESNTELLTCGGQQPKRDQFGNTVLHNMLLQNCHPNVIKSLLESQETDVNSSGYFRYSPLQLAVLGDHPMDVITTLMSHGADLEHRDLSGKTVLHLVFSQGSQRYGKRKSILEILLEGGADIHAKDVREQTPLHYACINLICPKGIKILLHAGVSVCNQDIYGQTPLHVALHDTDRSFTIFEVLRFGGKSVMDVQDTNGRTPLHLAVALKRVDLSSVLVKEMIEKYNAPYHILDNNGKSPVDMATDNEIITIFTLHALRLKCANLPLLVSYEFDFQPYCSELEMYKKEIESMKLHCFGPHTYYSIFSSWMDPTYLYDYKNSSCMRLQVLLYCLGSTFPAYAYLMRNTFEDNQKRLKLLDESVDKFDVGLPTEVRRMILSLLNNRDLMNIIKCID